MCRMGHLCRAGLKCRDLTQDRQTLFLFILSLPESLFLSILCLSLPARGSAHARHVFVLVLSRSSVGNYQPASE